MRKTRVLISGLVGLALVAMAPPAFGWQGTLSGTPLDNLLHTAVTYAGGPLVAGGSILALAIGGTQSALTHGERGHSWLWGGGIGLGIAATARFVPAFAWSELVAA